MDFRVVAPDVEEVTEGPPHELVVENALRKARAVALVGGEGRSTPAIRILGVDTAVAAAGRIYGKPRDEHEARSFLEALSGRDHEVWSGMALVTPDPADPDAGAVATAASSTTVRFRRLGRPELQWYLASGEWRERAGAYAIQGRGAALVERIEGDYWTVVGLPVPELVRAAPDLFAN